MSIQEETEEKTPSVISDVIINWGGKKPEIEHLKNIDGYTYEDDIYFFFGLKTLGGRPPIKVVWVKNPDLRTIEIIPNRLRDKETS